MLDIIVVFVSLWLSFWAVLLFAKRPTKEAGINRGFLFICLSALIYVLIKVVIIQWFFLPSVNKIRTSDDRISECIELTGKYNDCYYLFKGK